MDNNLLILLAIVAIVIVGGLMIYNRRRSDHLRERFGSEYERQVDSLLTRFSRSARSASRRGDDCTRLSD